MKSVFETPTGKGSLYAHSFPFVQEAAATKRDEPESKVRFNDFIEARATSLETWEKLSQCLEIGA